MKKIFILAVLAFFGFSPLFGQSIKIPSIDLITRIYGYDGQLMTVSQVEMGISVDGGYKFGGNIVLGFNGIFGLDPDYTTPLPDVIYMAPPIVFKSLDIVVREVFGSPLHLYYFIGENDKLCYGDDFEKHFGTNPLFSLYRPHFFDQTLQIKYEGIHQIKGNGLKLQFLPPDSSFGLLFYIYQDYNFTQTSPLVTNFDLNSLVTGIYSSDIRFLLNTEDIKFEIFMGGTINSRTSSGYMRFGTLVLVTTPFIDLLLEAGIPQYGFLTFTEDMLFILFEPRIHLGLFTLIPSVFWRPGYYLQTQNPAESQKIDFNLNVGIGDLRNTIASGGIETNLETRNYFSTWKLNFSPYLSISTPGVIWEFRIILTALDSSSAVFLDPATLNLQGLIGIKAQF